MSDKQPNFHSFALRSMLFKGRTDWYISYLKAEKVAQVLVLLSDKTSDSLLMDAAYAAVSLPESIVYFAAGEADLAELLAEIFSLLSAIRFAATSRSLDRENALVLIAECEGIAQRLGSGAHPSPFISADDFSVAFQTDAPEQVSLGSQLSLGIQKDIKDTSNKGQTKGQHTIKSGVSEEQRERTAKILEIVTQNNGVSVRDIAKVVRNCSEKTIQRELALLIEQGLVKKTGERRWSLYMRVK